MAAEPEMTPFPVAEFAPGSYVHHGTLDDRTPENFGDQANIGFVVGEKCVAVIDTGGTAAVGRALRRAIAAVTDLPVCYVIITHFHPDHFFGAAAFRGPGVEFVAHAGYKRTMAERTRPYVNALVRDLGDAAQGSDVVAPTRLVSDEDTIDLGGRTLKLKAWSVAHTDNDLTVFDEATGTLWLGDLLFVDHTPVIDGSVLGFIDVLKVLETYQPKHYVSGHGVSGQPYPQPLLKERAYLELIVRETRAALKHRKTLVEAVDTVGQSERPNWVNFDMFHRRNVTATYTELEWE